VACSSVDTDAAGFFAPPRLRPRPDIVTLSLQNRKSKRKIRKHRTRRLGFQTDKPVTNQRSSISFLSIQTFSSHSSFH
jgi:hypothetical protein